MSGPTPHVTPTAPARTWLPTLVGGMVIGTAVAVWGPVVALAGVAIACGGLTAAWLLAMPVRAVTFYAFLLPFDVYLSTSLRVTSTQVFQALVLVVTASGVLLAGRTTSRASNLPAGVAPLGIGLIAYLVMSIAWSISPEASTRNLLRTVAALLMGGLAASVIRDTVALRRVCSAAALGALVTSLYGYAQFARGGHDQLYRYFSPFYSELFVARGAGFSVVATFSNPNILAGYGAMVLPIIWALATDARSSSRVFWAAVSVLVSGVVLLTFSKAGWVLVMALAASWVLARITAGTRPVAAAGAGIALGLFVLFIDRLLGYFSLVFPNAREMSVDSRLGLWRVSLSAFAESPLLGFGLDGFAAATSELRATGLADLVRAHNIYLQTLVDIGLVGTVLFWTPLAMVFVLGLKSLLLEPFRDSSPLHLGLVLSALGFILFGVVESLNVSNNYVNLYWLVFGLLSASTQLRRRAAGAPGRES